MRGCVEDEAGLACPSRRGRIDAGAEVGRDVGGAGGIVVTPGAEGIELSRRFVRPDPLHGSGRGSTRAMLTTDFSVRAMISSSFSKSRSGEGSSERAGAGKRQGARGPVQKTEPRETG